MNLKNSHTLLKLGYDDITAHLIKTSVQVRKSACINHYNKPVFEIWFCLN